MKLIFRSALFAWVLTLGFTHCGKNKKKDWQCNCNVTDTTQAVTINASQYIERQTKTNADTACAVYGRYIGQTHVPYTYTCSIK